MNLKLCNSLVAEISVNGATKLDALSINEVVELLQYANKRYCLGKPVMEDDVFDLIRDHLEKRDPDSPFLATVGAKVAICDRRKNKLPYFMGSMNKIKSDGKELAKFISGYPGAYVATDKLDGNSALLQYDLHGKLRMFTRGDGEEGQEITDIIPYIQGVPKAIKGVNGEYTVRGELIISKEGFEEGKGSRANARNMVAGLVNAKKPDMKLLPLVRFVAYSQLVPNEPPSVQLASMKKRGFEVVYNIKLKEAELTFDKLSQTLLDRKDNSPYEVDGIVISHDHVHPLTTKKEKNPVHSFAFKQAITEDTAEVIVTGVEWNISSAGYLKPTVLFEPVTLKGVKIQRATGFHGEFIQTNVVGVGARVLLTRSGDVIPHIVKVISPAPSGPLMPTVAYDWTTGGKDIKIADKENNAEYDAKQVEHFFTVIKVKGFGPGTVKKLVDAGFDTVSKVIKMTPAQFRQVPGIDKKADEFAQQIAATMKTTNCVTLMKASNMFGRGMGETKMQAIIDAVPQVLDPKYKVTADELISQVPGVKDRDVVNLFLTGLAKFREFTKENSLTNCSPTKQAAEGPKKPQGNKLEGEMVLFTGFRNKELEAQIEEQGGKVASGFSKKVTLLIMKENEQSTKVEKAREAGTKIMLLADFLNRYGLVV